MRLDMAALQASGTDDEQPRWRLALNERNLAEIGPTETTMIVLEKLARTSMNALSMHILVHGCRHDLQVTRDEGTSPAFDASWNASIDLSFDQDPGIDDETAEAMAATRLAQDAVEATARTLSDRMPLVEVATLILYGLSIDMTEDEVEALIAADNERYEAAMEQEARARLSYGVQCAQDLDDLGDEAWARRYGI